MRLAIEMILILIHPVKYKVPATGPVTSVVLEHCFTDTHFVEESR